MRLADIVINDETANLMSTDDLLQIMLLLKELLRDRAKTELAEMDQRRNVLLEMLGGKPVACDYEDEERPPRSRGPVNPPKYRNPENPLQTWSGRGKRPAWVVDYLAGDPSNLLQDLLIP
jgi:DNA-binding protein H-NS